MRSVLRPGPARSTRVRALHAKVKNQRRDALHKWSRRTVDRCAEIVIGDVRPSAVGKTTLAKSVYDSGWTMLRGMLKYKSEHAGIRCDVVSEYNSTRTCSCCGAIPDSSPRGRAGLRIREWTCCECGALHDRDVNAARNILVGGASPSCRGNPRPLGTGRMSSSAQNGRGPGLAVLSAGSAQVWLLWTVFTLRSGIQVAHGLARG